MSKPVTITISRCDQLITARIPFNAGSLTGTNNPYDTGRLSRDESEKFYADRNSIDYAVLSYSTPIAWHTPRGWYFVAQKFSVTTSKHQGKVRANAA